MPNRYENEVKKEWEKFQRENKLLPNIMLLGATGCGKSSFINRVFCKKLAPVNDVSRGTDGFQTYLGREHGMGVNLIDSRGYEMEDGSGESFTAYRDSIKQKMAESRDGKPLEKIHIIWYCISVAAERIQDYDIKIIKLLRSDSDLRRRVAIVFTKCDEDDECGSTAQQFRHIITSEVGANIPMFEVSTDDELELEIEELISWSAEQLDDADIKEAFISSQVVNLNAKHDAANTRIAIYAASAAGIAAAPIPISDALLLTPLQISMSAHIIHIYGMDNYVSISSALIGNVVISNLGKAFAGGLLKLIPGIGSLVGGLINAGVASLITSALGFAISEICYDSCKKIAKGEFVDFSTMFALETIQTYIQEYKKSKKH